ncbi:hypothetical protein SODALDRAFT_348932 [Sodiomyces alkalinus F11]|uniref:Cyanovirin-N domain-containing protein n=1 Tax=Sodiomyces alkalinus (strain CBS 110278 / VKM F-3762 / F11) TaxID=1314773 RepID=A0A3N2Q1Y3_SODAK|nr:hypothetical protein SODALDRAFT_348932 [Sodiomyces alkalinus F11]ROT40757.1 hypothetical protein SODALDRAFT_348932 [Sodiomyces alkalinus F11]
MRFLFLSFAALAAANFHEHCWNIKINTDRWNHSPLEMACRDSRTGDIWYNELDLNKCITNVDGNMRWSREGNYSHSVEKLFLDRRGPGIDLTRVMLNGNCRKDSGNPLLPPTWWFCAINLSEEVKVDRGQVSCLGQRSQIERPSAQEEAELKAQIGGAQE